MTDCYSLNSLGKGRRGDKIGKDLRRVGQGSTTAEEDNDVGDRDTAAFTICHIASGIGKGIILYFITAPSSSSSSCHYIALHHQHASIMCSIF